jgi:hypothetical protein
MRKVVPASSNMIWLKRVILLGVTIALSLLVSEGLLRLVVNPVNYLRPKLISGTILRWRVKPGSAGHDEWGFRNVEVPTNADIVTIGDSMTYGNMATAEQSWPSWLGHMTESTVYNLALGGYGPVDYRYLMSEKAIKLKPRWVIVGFYLGNDVFDSYRSAYSRDYWSFLRSPDAVPVATDRPAGVGGRGNGRRRSNIEAMRLWVGQYSVLYRMAGVALADLVRPFVWNVLGVREGMIVVDDPERGLVTLIDLGEMSRATNLEDPKVVEGLRITLDSFDAIRQECREHGIAMMIVLIPTKVSVFVDYLAELGIRDQASAIDQLVMRETRVVDQVEGWLDDREIPYVNVLDDLRAKVASEFIYGSSSDGHPVSLGYRVIADSVHWRMQE